MKGFPRLTSPHLSTTSVTFDLSYLLSKKLLWKLFKEKLDVTNSTHRQMRLSYLGKRGRSEATKQIWGKAEINRACWGFSQIEIMGYDQTV
jgi:hypothetical protein